MKKTRLLSEVHETARGLARIDAIDKHTLEIWMLFAWRRYAHFLPNRSGPFAAEPR
jgi:hypothetical protein